MLDMGHVVESLNKLDLGDKQKVLLTSRDNQSILLASFEDIKQCFVNSFSDLGGASAVAGGPVGPTGQPLPMHPQHHRRHQRGGGGHHHHGMHRH